MKKKLINLWKDPVVSAALGAILYASIITVFQNINIGQGLRRMLMLKIDLWIYISALVVFIIVYELVKKAKRFRYDEQTLILDRTLFSRIRKQELLFDNKIHWLRYQDFGAPFKSEQLMAINVLTEENDKPDFEFLNPKLEKKKKKLVRAVNEFQERTSSYIFGREAGLVSIPPEWEFRQTDRFHKALRETDEKRKDVCRQYDEFVKLGRRVLKV